jgi:hypothetical protein
MKKLLTSVLLVLTLIGLTGCNKQIFDFNNSFKKVHLYETDCCYEINSWRDYEDGEQLQLDIKGKGRILVSSVNCFLVEDKCPICD